MRLTDTKDYEEDIASQQVVKPRPNRQELLVRRLKRIEISISGYPSDCVSNGAKSADNWIHISSSGCLSGSTMTADTLALALKQLAKLKFHAEKTAQKARGRRFLTGFLSRIDRVERRIRRVIRYLFANCRQPSAAILARNWGHDEAVVGCIKNLSDASPQLAQKIVWFLDFYQFKSDKTIERLNEQLDGILKICRVSKDEAATFLLYLDLIDNFPTQALELVGRIEARFSVVCNYGEYSTQDVKDYFESIEKTLRTSASEQSFEPNPARQDNGHSLLNAVHELLGANRFNDSFARRVAIDTLLVDWPAGALGARTIERMFLLRAESIARRLLRRVHRGIEYLHLRWRSLVEIYNKKLRKPLDPWHFNRRISSLQSIASSKVEYQECYVHAKEISNNCGQFVRTIVDARNCHSDFTLSFLRRKLARLKDLKRIPKGLDGEIPQSYKCSILELKLLAAICTSEPEKRRWLEPVFRVLQRDVKRGFVESASSRNLSRKIFVVEELVGIADTGSVADLGHVVQRVLGFLDNFDDQFNWTEVCSVRIVCAISQFSPRIFRALNDCDESISNFEHEDCWIAAHPFVHQLIERSVGSDTFASCVSFLLTIGRFLQFERSRFDDLLTEFEANCQSNSKSDFEVAPGLQTLAQQCLEVDSECRSKLRRILGPACRDFQSIQAEICALSERLAAGDNQQDKLKKRLESLRALRDKPIHLKETKLQKLKAKLESYYARLTFEKLTQIATQRLNCGFILPYLKLFQQNKSDFAHAVFGLGKQYQRLASNLLELKNRERLLKLEANRQFLVSLNKAGIDSDVWFYGPGRREFTLENGKSIFITVERDLVEILHMGQHFNTCLGFSGCNFFSAISNAVDVNKNVVYIRDEAGKVMARQLVGITEVGVVSLYHFYCHENSAEIRPLQKQFLNEWILQMGAYCGSETPRKLVAPRWYDDGAVDWDIGDKRAEINLEEFHVGEYCDKLMALPGQLMNQRVQDDLRMFFEDQSDISAFTLQYYSEERLSFQSAQQQLEAGQLRRLAHYYAIVELHKRGFRPKSSSCAVKLVKFALRWYRPALSLWLNCSVSKRYSKTDLHSLRIVAQALVEVGQCSRARRFIERYCDFDDIEHWNRHSVRLAVLYHQICLKLFQKRHARDLSRKLIEVCEHRDDLKVLLGELKIGSEQDSKAA